MTRLTAHEAYRNIINSPADVRALAQKDLFFLMVYVLKRKDMDNDWCFARCRELARQPDGFLDLWAREHYKSTIITVGKTIQDILNNPEITVGIFSHTRPIAKSFLAQIKRTFEESKLLQELFPDVLYSNPRKEAHKWSEDGGIIVKRKTNPKEATVEAWGLVDGQPTGKHFSLLIYDDVVTRESVSTAEMIKKVNEAWALSLNLGSRDGKIRIIGTRYHMNDTYQEIMKREAAIPRIYPATVDATVTGEPVFLSRDSLQKKYQAMGAYVFGCQMLQNPVADKTQGFKKDWLNYYSRKKADIKRMNIALLVDPASSKKEAADFTVMWVIGRAEDGNYYILDGVRDKLSLTERTRHLFRLHRLYRPLITGYEQYGQQADIEHMQEKMRDETYHFSILALGGKLAKVERIKRLIPLFEQGKILLAENLYYQNTHGETQDLSKIFIEEEYDFFPVSQHDDMLDCLARIFDVQLAQPNKASAFYRKVKQTYDPFSLDY